MSVTIFVSHIHQHASSHISPDLELLTIFLYYFCKVPGIGPTGAIVLATGEDRVTTTHQLIGKFLGLRGADEAHREVGWVL